MTSSQLELNRLDDVDLDHAEQQAAEQGAAQVADAAQHGGGERLDADQEADVELGDAEAGGVCSKAATPAMAPPSTKTSMMTRSLLTPISAAVSGSWATARTPRPSRLG